MIAIELKPLLARLDRLCMRAMESAAGRCVARGRYEVTVEHVLLEMIEQEGGDFAAVVDRFELDRGRLVQSLTLSIDGMRSGNAGKPVLSPILVEWIENAWMIASIELGLAEIRSCALAVALVARPRRFLVDEQPELERVGLQDMKRALPTIIAASGEEARQAGTPMAAPSAAKGPREGGALARFAVDLTAAARAGKIDPVFGRDREIRQVVDILARRRKNNPIVVGDAGVGKTAIVEGLALRIAENDVPDFLRDVSVFALDLGLLQAGAGVKGEFESRLKSVIEEVKSASARTILFIDEAHTLIGAGNAQGSGDAANLLKPVLARGELRTIAATTWGEYKKYFEEDAALARRFQPVVVDEPSAEQTALMLRGVKSRYEDAHGVSVRDDAIDAAARLAARYITGRLLPDKAVDLLDTASARVRIGQTARPGAVEDVERRIQALEREDQGAARDRAGGVAVSRDRSERIARELASSREELSAVTRRWKAQQQAVARVKEARGAGEDTAAIERALAELREVQGQSTLVRLEVDPEVVAQVVADWTGVPVGRMVEDEVAHVVALESRLKERIKGQDHTLEVVARALREAKLGLKDPGKPQVFLLVGPSGVGKTELGLAVADVLFGGERFTVTINMSEYQDREMGVSGLIGAKPGYVGYGKGGALTEAVRQRPYSVVILDEIEKSCVEVRNLFYQVFDKGELTDGTGRRVDFKNTIIFLTTNLTADVIQSMCEGPSRPSPREVLAAIRPVLSAALQPAWLARTSIVPFYPLEPSALATIARMKLGKVAARLAETHGVELPFGDDVVAQIAARCEDVETGARNIDFILLGTLLPMISSALLARMAEGKIPPRMEVRVDASGELELV